MANAIICYEMRGHRQWDPAQKRMSTSGKLSARIDLQKPESNAQRAQRLFNDIASDRIANHKAAN